MKVGENFLISTDNWFFAPDGKQYRAVFGKVHAITQDTALGIKTNRNSTNWYVNIGNMIVAGCQVHYAIRTDNCSFDEYSEYDDKGEPVTRNCRIYNANQR